MASGQIECCSITKCGAVPSFQNVCGTHIADQFSFYTGLKLQVVCIFNEKRYKEIVSFKITGNIVTRSFVCEGIY